MEQCILFRGYSSANITRVMPLTQCCGAVHIILRLQYAQLKISINFSFPANSYSLYLVKLKIDLLLDHGVEQCILFQGYSIPNINKVMPL